MKMACSQLGAKALFEPMLVYLINSLIAYDSEEIIPLFKYFIQSYIASPLNMNDLRWSKWLNSEVKFSPSFLCLKHQKS